MTAATEAARGTGIPLMALLRGAWIALGAVQLGVDSSAIFHEVTHMDGGDESNVVRLPVVNVQIRQSLIDELNSFYNGGGPDDDDEWWKTMITRAVTYGGLVPAVLEYALNLKPGVVKKWMDGESAPLPYARRAVASIIASLMLGL